MPSKYTYEFTKNGEDSLREITLYISDNLKNKSAALNFIETIEQKSETVCAFPQSYPTFSDDVSDIRKVIVDNYKLFYIIRDDKKLISVLKILYSGMDIDEDKIRN